MSDSSVPDYYRPLTEEEEGKNEPERKGGSAEEAADGEAELPAAPSDPGTYRADAFRLLRPEGEWQDGSIYTLTGPTLDGVTHNITVNMEDEVEADSVYDTAGQELALGSIFRP